MQEENSPMEYIEQLKLRIKVKSSVHQCLLDYLGFSVKKEKSEEILKILKENNIPTNKGEFRNFLETISHLWEIHQSKEEMRYKIESLLKSLKEEMKVIFFEKEIFDIFRLNNDAFILLILVEQNILSIDTIIENIDFGNINIIMYFYPEIRKYNEKFLNNLITKNKMINLEKFIEENDKNLESFYKIRKEGEKEPKIVELIKEDKVDEFISFIEQTSINLNKKIVKGKTIFEEKCENLTPIEYSALFGSISVFKYLYLKKVDININVIDNSIIDYAIQGRNYEIIHLLEERREFMKELNKIENQEHLIEVSIKMHYIEIFEYFITNYNVQVNKKIIHLIFKYRNYQLFDQLIKINKIDLKDKVIIDNLFIGICINGNVEIIKILMNHPNLDINTKDEIFDYSFTPKEENEEEKERSSKIIFIVIDQIQKLQEYFIII